MPMGRLFMARSAERHMGRITCTWRKKSSRDHGSRRSCEGLVISSSENQSPHCAERSIVGWVILCYLMLEVVLVSLMYLEATLFQRICYSSLSLLDTVAYIRMWVLISSPFKTSFTVQVNTFIAGVNRWLGIVSR